MSAGCRFRTALTEHRPLAIVGAINAYSALLAEHAGHSALYLSGAGVANASHGLPDLGMTTLNDVLEDARRITSVTELPLLVDIDTGFGGAFAIGRCIRELEGAGVAAVHIEDQVAQKRCGHRPNKVLVAGAEMVDRIVACVDARRDPDFFILARTDALAQEGLEAALERARTYVAAGADGIFVEAAHRLEDYRAFTQALEVPVLANVTEFGQTPLFSQGELAEAGVAMALYPLSAFRAMSRAALDVYRAIRHDGDQRAVLERMQTREELYQILRYHDFEAKLDKLFSDSGNPGGKNG